jgi:DNA-binding CsgD family transcriptional regulator
MARKRDLIDLVEACYRVEGDDDSWLKGILDASSSFIDRGIFDGAYTFDATHPDGLKMIAARFEPPVEPAQLGAFLGSVPQDYVRKTWLARPSGYASTIEGFEGPIADGLFRFGGARDVLAVTGLDPTGHGVWLGSIRARRGRPKARELDALARLGAHLATGYRIRRRLAEKPAQELASEAVLSPSGALEHAEGPAKTTEARTELRRAVVALERVRSAAGHRDPELALASWKGLVSARWSLLDRFESDGRRFVVATENAAALPSVRALSPREEQVVAYAALGHDNKVIAYELGLSASTVRVLMARAAAKLEVRRRVDIIARYQALVAKRRGSE